ncbi:MAG: response regulator [Hyphomicrobium sp.]|uniref:response regulator n=1 Tax=Hyphomicrobium sp. TaxID=82 RepID=UPI001328A303|nr:response regulator [Hyphomicrobium sp.]KAB2939960.1 MAG: response regulator [Hyphomicrobium sp.]MBZ0209895.1 response regulator [Hyphomicrobium sp.]
MPAGDQQTILIVDDEPEVRALLRTGLEGEGFAVVEAADGQQAMALIDRLPISLVTLDLKLGGEDGLKVARELRAAKNTPMIMITGKGDAVDRIVGLELGADDYIPKPFLMREVVARIRAVLRRYTGAANASSEARSDGGQRYGFDGWTVDLSRREVRDPRDELRELTTAEFNLLALFLQKPGRVLSRDELMDLLKGHDWTPMDRSIDALVARLRKKLEPESERPTLVKTVRGVGYAFAGAVKRL